MKKLFFIICFGCITCSALSQTGSAYTPTQGNLQARDVFRDMKYGMFIHWGLFSVLGDGEWVMNNRNIRVKDYSRLLPAYNPVDFDPAEWVATVKAAGMKYITFITRHHDGFSNWDTKVSDWKITNSPYRKDAFKMLADECHKQNIKLFVYYSLLDWTRNDYPWNTGRTGKGTGRTAETNYASYLQFMKDQLTELLTNYGKIDGVWFDGHWDQTAPEGAKDRTSRIDWRYNEIYSLIHRLQPECLIGNNHHLTPFEGEDFQMFERDLPGENNSGLSFQKPSDELPLETCETMNGSWGYNITDRRYKSVKDVIHLLVNAAGRNANLLLNVGPMPNGDIQPEFTDTLKSAGAWLQAYGESVYGTRGNVIPPQSWGVVTQKNKTLYVHILNSHQQPYIFLPGATAKITKAVMMNSTTPVTFKQLPEGIFLYPAAASSNQIDNIIQLTLK